MLKKLFKYIESRASYFAAQDIVTMLKNGKTKAVWGIIILMGIVTFVGTLQTGSCVDCYTIENLEVLSSENFGDNLLDKEIGNTHLDEWKKTKQYVPFDNIWDFIKSWLINFIPITILLIGMYMFIYFIFLFIRNKIMDRIKKIKL